MKILITVANGFLGRALVNRILADGGLGGGGSLQRLTLVVRSEASGIHHPLVRIVRGDLRDPAIRAAAVEDGTDCAFHLAGVLIAQSESDFELGRSVNLDATVAFFDELSRL